MKYNQLDWSYPYIVHIYQTFSTNFENGNFIDNMLLKLFLNMYSLLERTKYHIWNEYFNVILCTQKGKTEQYMGVTEYPLKKQFLLLSTNNPNHICYPFTLLHYTLLLFLYRELNFWTLHTKHQNITPIHWDFICYYQFWLCGHLFIISTTKWFPVYLSKYFHISRVQGICTSATNVNALPSFSWGNVLSCFWRL